MYKSKQLLCIGAIFGLIFFFACSKQDNLETNLLETDDITHLEIEEDYTEEELDAVITPIDLNVKLKDGALWFDNHEDLDETVDILAKANYVSRKAWEEKIGFTSLATLYIEALIELEDNYVIETGADIPQSFKTKYDDLLDFSTDYPILKNYSLTYGGISNKDGYFFVGDKIGSINDEGAFWVKDGTKEALQQVFLTKKADLSQGIEVYLNENPEEITFRTCASVQATFTSGFRYTNTRPWRWRGKFTFKLITRSEQVSNTQIRVRKLVEFWGESWRRCTFGSWCKRRCTHSATGTIIMQPDDPNEAARNIPVSISFYGGSGANGTIVFKQQTLVNELRPLGNDMRFEEVDVFCTHEFLEGNGFDIFCD